MPIRIPKPNLADRFLRQLGKRRAVQLPQNTDKFGIYFYSIGIKESIWKTLIRPKNQELPEGTLDVFTFEELKQYKNSDWGNDDSD